jgi:hypothetical protein
MVVAQRGVVHLLQSSILKPGVQLEDISALTACYKPLVAVVIMAGEVQLSGCNMYCLDGAICRLVYEYPAELLLATFGLGHTWAQHCSSMLRDQHCARVPVR